MLFKEFQGKTKAEWLEKVTKDLKGKKSIDSFNWHVEDMEFTPFFHSEDAINANPIVDGRSDNSWEIGERIVIQNSDYVAANKQAVDTLMKGANALLFVFDKLPTQTELTALLENIQLEWISTHFRANNSLELAETFTAIIEAKEHSPAKVVCSFNSLNANCFDQLNRFKKAITELPKAKFLTVDVSFENDVVYNLAKAIKKGNDYLELLSDNGFDLSKTHQQIQFIISLNDEYFPSIAKVRALKSLWQQVLSAWSSDLKLVPNIEVHLTKNAQIEDENYNKIKATTQAMSAVIGGANRLYVYPSDSFKNENGTTFSRRIALNVQHLLQQESYLDRTIDASAGSYFIEELTEKIAEKAWAIFQDRL
ncbi:MAG: methylmalonyl-CoA mutase family protein [Saprospiraceae bacterium]